MTPVLLLGLLGCDAFTKAKDTLDGLFDPVVAEGIVLGIEPPANQDLADLLERSAYRSGTTVTLFMADARDVRDIEQAPITGAEVRLVGPGVDAPVTEVDAGLYALDPVQQPVSYAAGEVWTLEVLRERNGRTSASEARLTLPPDADFSAVIPQQHVPGQPIQLDFTGLGYSAALVVVLDDAGQLTFSNEPRTIREIYDLTHGSGELGVLTLPGEAFPDEGLFAVGVAGMVNTRAADLTEMNTALSSVITGQMRMYGVSTLPEPPPQ